MAEHESESGTDGTTDGSTDGGAAGSTSGESTSGGARGEGSGSSGPSRASAAFAAGRAERRDGTSDGGVDESTSGGPREAATVEQAAPSTDDRTEAVRTSGGSQGPATAVASRPEPSQQAGTTSGRSGPSAVGGALRRVLNLLATLAVLVGLLCAVVLAVFIVLRLVAVNPQNVVAQAVGSIADRLVGAFRDLFLVPDPVVGLAVNYGLAALCWLVAGLIVARILRAVGRALP